MDRDAATGLHVDPLADLEVQRALALARARESYPAVPRETLLGYCEAAWDVALKADPRGRDLQGSFDRALLIIAWTQRRSGGRVPLRELIDQTVPRIALEPFIGQPADPGDAPEVGVQPEEAVPSRRSPLRLPFTSPIPVGAALAAGVVGVAVLSEAEVIPIAPLQPAGSDEPAGADEAATRDAGERRADKSSGAGAGQSDEMVAGLLEGIGDEASQAFAAPPAGAAAESVGRSAAIPAVTAEASGGGGSKAARAGGGGAPAQVAVETAGAQAAPPAPVAPAAPAPAPPQPVVRVEMAPPTMILEVSAPQRPPLRTDDEDGREQPEPDRPDAGAGLPADPDDDAGRDDQDDTAGERDRRSARDDDEGPLDLLEDVGRPDDEDDGADEDEAGVDEDGDETAPTPATPPVTTAPPAPETAPAPPPAEATAPAAPADPAAPTAPAPAAPAPAAAAPTTAAPAPAAPVPTPPAPPA